MKTSLCICVSMLVQMYDCPALCTEGVQCPVLLAVTCYQATSHPQELTSNMTEYAHLRQQATSTARLSVCLCLKYATKIRPEKTYWHKSQQP